jgi:hypothetical protein
MPNILIGKKEINNDHNNDHEYLYVVGTIFDIPLETVSHAEVPVVCVQTFLTGVGPGQFLLHCCVLYGCGVYQISF